MKRCAICTLAVVMLLLAGCNTMQGLGKDIEKAGETIQKSSK
jgi:entericidin B